MMYAAHHSAAFLAGLSLICVGATWLAVAYFTADALELAAVFVMMTGFILVRWVLGATEHQYRARKQAE